ncbi:MAG: hypothetical protein ACRDZY_20700, partial [Acidimicrobiales bacterium]
MTYNVTVHLSNDFRRTCLSIGNSFENSFEQAALDGVYDGDGFSFRVEASSHLDAAEVAYQVCNSYD